MNQVAARTTDPGGAVDPGPSSADVLDQRVPGLGRVHLIPMRPADHADLVHAWVTEERARFWGMGSRSLEEVRDIYAYIEQQDTHHAYLVLLDAVPVALFQTYDPKHDPIGQCYPVEEGDMGIHLLLAPPVAARPGFTPALGGVLLTFCFADTGTHRVVVEPDAENARALRRLQRSDFEFGGEVQLPDKRARLAFLTRTRFESMLPRAPG